MANRLDLADAQLLGWSYGKKGYFLTDLVVSMGLTKSEWKQWKEKYPKSLNDDDVTDIDEYFSKCKNK